MPHIIDTSNGFCETHNQFEYTVLEAGKVKRAFSDDDFNRINYNYPDKNYNSSATTITAPNLFQVKFYPDNENYTFKQQPKTKIHPQRLLIENEVSDRIFNFFFLNKLLG